MNEASWGARVARIAVAVLACIIASEVGLRAAALGRAPLTFDVGPSTGAYLAGFTDSEERPPTTLRWARNEARIAWPLVASGGPTTLIARYGRFVDGEIPVSVRASGREIGSFSGRPGRQRLEQLEFNLPAGEPLSLEFLGQDPKDLALALDWVQLRGPGFRPAPTLLAPRLLVAGVLLIALMAGCSWAGALGASGVSLALLVAFARVDPFGLVHVLPRVTLPALLAATLVGLLLRARPAGRLVTLAFLLSYLLKGALVFHPSYFYNDVRNNRRFVEAIRDDPGGLIERARAAQPRIGVAYPRIIGGQKYTFPYSPVFFAPFALLRDTTSVEEGLKQAVVAAAAAETVLVFLLSARVFGAGTGALAALLAAFLPIQASRLLLALWSTVGGHVFDVLALLWACDWALRPESRRALTLTAGAVTASYLTYVASLFNMALFTGWLGLLVGRLRWRAWALGVGGALLTVVVLYFGFTRQFVTEILPAYLRAGSAGGSPPPPRSLAFLEALGRIPLFFGWLYPWLAAFGFWLAKRRADAGVYRVLGAYGLVFVVLVLLRGLGGGLFKDMKEIEFVAPLVALLAGAALEELARSVRWGRALVLAALVWLVVADGVLPAWGYFRTWTQLAQLP